jgi:hypothetical protein
LNLSPAKTVSSGNADGLAGFSVFAPAEASIQAKFLCIEVAPGSLARRLPAPKPRQFRTEFSVTPVFRVRIVNPLDAATAEKWQGRPLLAKANGVGRIWLYWNLPHASVRTYYDATVSDDRVHLRTIAIPLRPKYKNNKRHIVEKFLSKIPLLCRN